MEGGALFKVWSEAKERVPVTTIRDSSPAFLAGKKVTEQEFQRPQHHNHLTSINVNIEHPDDGNGLIA